MPFGATANAILLIPRYQQDGDGPTCKMRSQSRLLQGPEMMRGKRSSKKKIPCNYSARTHTHIRTHNIGNWRPRIIFDLTARVNESLQHMKFVTDVSETYVHIKYAYLLFFGGQHLQTCSLYETLSFDSTNVM